MDKIFDGQKGSSTSCHLIWCKLQCIPTIFSDRRPCCLGEGLLQSVYKEITDVMLITQIQKEGFRQKKIYTQNLSPHG